MKITAKVLQNYTTNYVAKFDDAYNIANNRPTRAQAKFLSRVFDSYYGICGNVHRPTMKQIKEYNEIHGE